MLCVRYLEIPGGGRWGEARLSELTSPGLTSSLLLEGIWSSVASIRESFRRDTGEQRGTKLHVAKGRWGRGVYLG